MNTTLPEGVKLAEDVNAALANVTPKCEVIICVPFTHLASINNVIDTNKVLLTVPNMSFLVTRNVVSTTMRPLKLFVKKFVSPLTII